MIINVTSLKQYVNQHVEIFLNNEFKYTGKIIRIEDDTIIFLDKFNKEVGIDSSIIILIQPIKEAEND